MNNKRHKRQYGNKGGKKVRIEKFYGQNVNLGNYELARLGLTIKLDKDIKSGKELEKVSNELLQLARRILGKEIRKIKEQNEQKEKEGTSDEK